MIKKKLNEILKNHRLWLSDAGGVRANLRHADLRHANLRHADLHNADLRHANGFDIQYLRNIRCQFFVGFSKKWQIITIGCVTHSVLEWMSYIESNEDFYLPMCNNKESHDECIEVICEGIEYKEKEI